MLIYDDGYFQHVDSSTDIIAHSGVKGMKWGHRRTPMKASTRRRIRNIAIGAAGVGLAAGAGYLAYKHKIPQRIGRRLAKKASAVPISKPSPTFKPTLPKTNTATNAVKQVAKTTLPNKNTTTNAVKQVAKTTLPNKNTTTNAVKQVAKHKKAVYIPKSSTIDRKVVRQQLLKYANNINKDIAKFKNTQKEYQETMSNLKKLSNNNTNILTEKSKTRRNALKKVIDIVKRTR